MADLEKMANQSGEGQEAPRYDLPLVRLNGEEGVFYKIYKDETGQTVQEPIEKEVIGTTLKFRRTLFQFTDEVSYFTNEHSSWKDTITLFEKKETKKGMSVNAIDKGTVGDLREKYQELRMAQMIYFLMDGGEVVKVQVKGKGLSNLFDFREELKKKEKKYMFQYVIKMTPKEEISRLKKGYYSINFEAVKEVENLDEVAGKLDEVNAKLEEIDAYYAKVDERMRKQYEPAIEPAKNGEIPVVEEPEQSEGEIDVKDIPL